MKNSIRPTVGFLSTWSVYEGTTIDSYLDTLLQGVYAAAQEEKCNLLIGCGISLPGNPRGSHTAWAVPGPEMDFIPVGPWNADGLIIIPDTLTASQVDYVRDLIRSGYPILFTNPEKAGRTVAVDNASGIQQGFDHLYQHGHRKIAFLAGYEDRGGDSAERLAAYKASLERVGIPINENLIAFGKHRREDGRLAMQQILDGGAEFTALIASNDLSALGAMDILRAAGRRIPEDVAIIGFDDILEARSQLPPLTTVRHPTFSLGYQAVLSILNVIRGDPGEKSTTRLATRLVVRQSCGCRAEDTPVISMDHCAQQGIETTHKVLAGLMADAAFIEARHSQRAEIETICYRIVEQFSSSLKNQISGGFDAELQRLVAWLEAHNEDANAWQAAFSTLRRGLTELLAVLLPAEPSLADVLIDHARLALAELTLRQTTDALVKHMAASNRLGLMTSQLLAALDVDDISKILTYHLPQLGIDHALLALYLPQEDDPFTNSTVLINIGLTADHKGRKFVTRAFPPAGLYPADDAYHLAILPLLVDEQTRGFVVLNASNLEPCAAIVHNLASALRSSRLYRDAIKGRELAEEANQLKSRFLSTVSHELRTPLSLIIGLSEMALQESAKPSRAIYQDIEQINTSAQHLARLIGDVLDLASSEAGQLRILREPLDLADVLQLATKIGEQLTVNKGLEWRANIPERGPWVLGDRTRLRQVVLNLISNAVKFTPQGKVTLDVAVMKQNVVISVSDSGIGVPPAEQESIFHEFHRSERAIQSGYGGLGLGLAISAQLVEQHGGSIGLRSPGDLGCGSTFYINLPVISFGNAVPDLGTVIEKTENRVLVLTEGPDTADPLRIFLEQQGFEHQICHTDQQVDWLSTIIASPPAAIILGEKLAAREGWTIIGLLKRQPATEHIPVWAYSLDMEQNQGELLELNFLQKPLHSDQLIETLSTHLPTKPEGRRVLVVDDDPGILEMHCQLVEQAGCRAVTARNGREALGIIEKNIPDLILLDLMMPEMDGFAVLDHLRSRERTRNIPVIILTARLLSDFDLEKLNRGVSSILNKGMFNAAETLNHIETALSQQNSLGGPTKLLIRQAMAFIHKRYADPLSREDIARQTGISADYLTDCFHQELGVTPVTYLRRYRIRRARELLETTDYSITQIAMKVGMPDSAHFTRTFQREVGITPRAYRHGKRKK